jgi:hypothetical protein
MHILPKLRRGRLQAAGMMPVALSKKVPTFHLRGTWLPYKIQALPWHSFSQKKSESRACSQDPRALNEPPRSEVVLLLKLAAPVMAKLTQ